VYRSPLWDGHLITNNLAKDTHLITNDLAIRELFYNKSKITKKRVKRIKFKKKAQLKKNTSKVKKSFKWSSERWSLINIIVKQKNWLSKWSTDRQFRELEKSFLLTKDRQYGNFAEIQPTTKTSFVNKQR